MMDQNRVYPAIMKNEGSVIQITFPDFPECEVRNTDQQRAISGAQGLLAQCILEIEDQERPEVKPSDAKDICLEENEQLVYIQVWLPYYRNPHKPKYVKKTLTIPDWLNELAVKNNVNFSEVLVKGLKKELGIKAR